MDLVTYSIQSQPIQNVLTAIAFALLGIYLFNGKPKSPTWEPQHIQTFHTLLENYSSLSPLRLTSNFAPEYTHTVLPNSLEWPRSNLANFRAHSAEIFSLFQSFKMRPTDEVHACLETNTVVAHCEMGGKLNSASEKGRRIIASGVEEWWTECVLFVKMDPRGGKVLEIKEFVDSVKAMELRRRSLGLFEG